MVYSSGAKPLPEIIDEIASGLRMDPTDLRFERVDKTLSIKLGFRKKGENGLRF